MSESSSRRVWGQRPGQAFGLHFLTKIQANLRGIFVLCAQSLSFFGFYGRLRCTKVLAIENKIG